MAAAADKTIRADSGAASGPDRAVIAKIARNLRSVADYELVAIARALTVSPVSLLGGVWYHALRYVEKACQERRGLYASTLFERVMDWPMTRRGVANWQGITVFRKRTADVNEEESLWTQAQ